MYNDKDILGRMKGLILAPKNRLTALQREILSPLIGKIVTGFRFEQSPDRHLYSDKFTMRLRHLEQPGCEALFGLHYKHLAPEEEPFLNMGINLVNTACETREGVEGFEGQPKETLVQFLRQPIRAFKLLPNQSLIVIFARQELIFECDFDSEETLYLGWAIH